MTSWDGVGVPPALRARLQRAKSSRTRSSLLSIAGQVGADITGFRPVGAVMGCIVLQVDPVGSGCGFFGGMGRRYVEPEVIVSGSNRAPGGFATYVSARYHGWESAIGRLQTEAVGLGADG